MPWHFLAAVTKGLEAAQEIVFLVFLVGGVIAILRKTGAIDAFLHTAVAKLGRVRRRVWEGGDVRSVRIARRVRRRAIKTRRIHRVARGRRVFRRIASRGLSKLSLEPYLALFNHRRSQGR